MAEEEEGLLARVRARRRKAKMVVVDEGSTPSNRLESVYRTQRSASTRRGRQVEKVKIGGGTARTGQKKETRIPTTNAIKTNKTYRYQRAPAVR